MPLLISFIGRNMKVSELVFEKISPLFNGEIKLVDVEYVKKNDGMHLIIYIDKDALPLWIAIVPVRTISFIP